MGKKALAEAYISFGNLTRPNWPPDQLRAAAEWLDTCDAAFGSVIGDPKVETLQADLLAVADFVEEVLVHADRLVG